MIEFIGQVIGFLALLVVVIAYQVFEDRHFYALKGLTYALLGIHFAMIGALTGALQEIVNTARNLGFLAGYQRCTIIGAIFFYAAFGAITIETTTDILPVISNIACSLAMLFLTGLSLRIVYWSGGLLWLIYTFANGAYTGFIVESLVWFSATVGIIRMIKTGYSPAITHTKPH